MNVGTIGICYYNESYQLAEDYLFPYSFWDGYESTEIQGTL